MTTNIKENDFMDNHGGDEDLDNIEDDEVLQAAIDKLHKIGKFKQSSGEVNEGILDLATKALAAYATVKMVMNVFGYAKFNNIMLPGGNFGIGRGQMPQIASERLGEYMQAMERQGIKFTHTTMKLEDLRITQNEYNKFKVMKLMDVYKKGKKVLPILVSSDGFVLDGSHRFIAQFNLNPKGDISVYKANVKIKPLLDASHTYAGVTYRSVSDKEVSK